MRIQVEVSIYPLMTEDIKTVIHQFCTELQRDAHEVYVGQMSTFISGESDSIFPRIQRAFEMTANAHNVVMTLKCSNACPETGSTDAKNRFT